MLLYHADMRFLCKSGAGRRLPMFGTLVLFVWGCGSDGAASPTTDEPAPRQGIVRLLNETVWDVEVSWLQQAPDGSDIARTTVPAGQQALLTEWPSSPLADLEFDLVLLVAPSTGPRVRRKALVQVNGDQMVILRAGADPYSVEISVVAL